MIALNSPTEALSDTPAMRFQESEELILDGIPAEILPQLRRQRENQRLLSEPLLTGYGKTAIDQVIQDPLHKIIWNRSTASDADGVNAIEPGGIELGRVVDPVCSPRPCLQRYFHKSH